MQDKVKVIGVIGQNGSGKDEVLKYLKVKYNIPFLSTGDMVREIATREGIELTRENLGKVSEKYFDELGKGCFVKLLADKICQNSRGITGISGIRSLDDISVLKGIFGHDFILIQVYISDPYVRYSRMIKRGEDRDPHTYEEFLQQDKTEEEIFFIKEAEQYATFSIDNDGTIQDLHWEIERLILNKGLLSD